MTDHPAAMNGNLRRGCRLLFLLLGCALVLALPSTAGALRLEIVNESGRAADDVYITVAGAPGAFDVPG